MTPPPHTPVLIAGGGPVGLTLSLLLTHHGVDHLLVEARSTTSHHPKARGISARSMEIFRRLGLEGAIRQAGLPADQVFFYRGRDLTDPDFVRTGLPEQPGAEANTPTPGLICSQDALEPLLLDRARPHTRFGTRLLSYRQDTDGIRAVLETDGSRSAVHADWLVGCDGAAGTVRTAAGIGLEGPTGLGRYLSIRFEAPLGPVVADRASASYFLTPPGRGGFLAVDNDRHWIYQYPLDPAAEPPSDLAALIRTAAGLPGLDVTVHDTMTWRMDARLATAYRHSRVLLAGDAAHVIPPTGGHGMNTGIGDADNLAWRLAYVTTGRAPESLLDGYDAERRPLARQVIDISTANAAQRSGYRIDDELLLTADYHSPTPLDLTGYHPSGRPGTRLPHLPLTPGASTLDLVGPDFTLFTPTAVPAPVRVIATDSWPPAARARWHELLGPATTLLVRPDGHIAWRTEEPPTALPDVLGRTPVRHTLPGLRR
ncbi:FAD-dependent monooxygenase [Kitasatospora sp. NPDC002227]|uniref:FAD-dependent monooxygenase n=1 Tax=Kitasatospora sp. NPDC002227 TaxID=3154773 RepID=UPI00332992FF